MTTTAPVTAQSTLAAAHQSAHFILEATMADVTDEVANRPAPGTANSVGSSYAHAIFAEDAVVNGMLRGQAPLAATTWAGRTGFDRPMPMPGAAGHGGDLGEWYRTVRVDLAACREYAKAVAAATAEFIASADDDFGASGLKAESLVRLAFLAVLPRARIIGTIGAISAERHQRLLRRLADHLLAPVQTASGSSPTR